MILIITALCIYAWIVTVLLVSLILLVMHLSNWIDDLERDKDVMWFALGLENKRQVVLDIQRRYGKVAPTTNGDDDD